MVLSVDVGFELIVVLDNLVSPAFHIMKEGAPLGKVLVKFLARVVAIAEVILQIVGTVLGSGIGGFQQVLVLKFVLIQTLQY